MTRADADLTQLWFRRYGTQNTPRARLVCFAHAGGGPSSFRTWHEHAPSDVDVLVVRYPGRQDRVLEPSIDEMHRLADSIAEALRPLLDLPVALFGHSMGSWVAYEVALRLGPAISGLFVSGQVAPGRGTRAQLDWSDAETMVAELRRIGGYDPELFDDPDLRDLLLPPIQADYTLNATYRPNPEALLSIPVTAYIGSADPDTVDGSAVAAWAEVTRGPFASRTFDGDHFYLAAHEEQLVHDITTRL